MHVAANEFVDDGIKMRKPALIRMMRQVRQTFRPWGGRRAGSPAGIGGMPFN